MKRLSFKVQVRGSTLSVDITEQGVTYRVESGGNLTITHDGELLSLEPNVTVVRALAVSPYG